MKAIYDVIRRPLLTEKGQGLQASQNVYAFEVNPVANKIEITAAIESLFGVKVLDVRTLNTKGKWKRFGRGYGRRSNWKKAYVKLEKGAQLDFITSANPAAE